MSAAAAMRWLRRDDGISSILGFIVAMVMLVASTATVAYFIASQPDPAQQEGSQQLQSAATRAVAQLVSTPGQPADWHTSPDGMERAGLLIDGSQEVADLDKLKLLQNGTIDNEDLLDALDLRSRGYSIHATGRVLNNNLIHAPSQSGISIVKGSDVDDPYIADASELDAGSWGDLQKVCKFNKQCADTIHNWEFNWTQHPSVGLGDVFPDHPWWVETQLVPQIAGFRATYVQGPTTNASIPDRIAQDAVFDSYDAGNVEIPRWSILQDNQDTCLPNAGGTDSTQDYALILGRLANSQDKCNEGNPHRDLAEGTRAWALMGPYDTSDAQNLWLNFSHVLQNPKNTTNCDEDACFAQRIMFWNATKGEGGAWDRIRPAHRPSQADGCTSTWDDEAPPVTKTWTGIDIELCQALEDSLGELWLAFFWDSWCEDSEGNETPCTGASYPNIWAIDDITVQGSVDGATHTFQSIPMTATYKALFTLSSGVDLNLDEASSGVVKKDYRVPVRVWTRALVKNGTNFLALDPGSAGDWLGGIGLESISASGTGEEALSDHRFTNVPNELNATAQGNGFGVSGYAWSTGATAMPVAGDPPPQHQLDIVHNTTDGSAGTVLIGQPYDGGGTVAAIAYNLSTLKSDDPDLYDAFMVNLLASALFDDPTFDLQGSEVPSDVSSPVATARRVVLTTVDDEDRFMLPIEITVYLWEQCIDSNLTTDACD